MNASERLNASVLNASKTREVEAQSKYGAFIDGYGGRNQLPDPLGNAMVASGRKARVRAAGGSTSKSEQHSSRKLPMHVYCYQIRS